MPLTVAVDGGGIAILFRYGIVVLINVARDAEIALLDRLTPILSEPFELHGSEKLHVDVRLDVDEQIDLSGTVLNESGAMEHRTARQRATNSPYYPDLIRSP